MTRKKEILKKKILKMKPGEKLDGFVAERVMGWKQNPSQKHLYCKSRDPEEWVNLKHWSPSTDIKAAMEVVEKLNLEYTFGVSKGLRDEDWDAVFFWSDGSGYNSKLYKAFGKTAPEAITKAAALSAVLEEKEEVEK